MRGAITMVAKQSRAIFFSLVANNLFLRTGGARFGEGGSKEQPGALMFRVRPDSQQTYLLASTSNVAACVMETRPSEGWG